MWTTMRKTFGQVQGQLLHNLETTLGNFFSFSSNSTLSATLQPSINSLLVGRAANYPVPTSPHSMSPVSTPLILGICIS